MRSSRRPATPGPRARRGRRGSPDRQRGFRRQQRRDNKSGTFQNLFPSNHLLYGAMDLTGLQNARDLRFSLTAKPQAALTLNLEVNLAALDRSSDFWYNAPALRATSRGRHRQRRRYRINPAYGTSLGQKSTCWPVGRRARRPAGGRPRISSAATT